MRRLFATHDRLGNHMPLPDPCSGYAAPMCGTGWKGAELVTSGRARKGSRADLDWVVRCGSALGSDDGVVRTGRRDVLCERKLARIRRPGAPRNKRGRPLPTPSVAP